MVPRCKTAPDGFQVPSKASDRLAHGGSFTMKDVTV